MKTLLDSLSVKHLLAGNVIFLIMLEIWAFINKTPEDTESEIIWDIIDYAKHGFMPRFLAGLLFAHFFLQRVASAADTDPVFRFLKKHPVIATMAGVVCGYLFWQRVPRLAQTTTDTK